jgi:hypothetical protein
LLKLNIFIQFSLECLEEWVKMAGLVHLASLVIMVLLESQGNLENQVCQEIPEYEAKESLEVKDLLDHQDRPVKLECLECKL